MKDTLYSPATMKIKIFQKGISGQNFKTDNKPLYPFLGLDHADELLKSGCQFK